MDNSSDVFTDIKPARRNVCSLRGVSFVTLVPEDTNTNEAEMTEIEATVMQISRKKDRNDWQRVRRVSVKSVRFVPPCELLINKTNYGITTPLIPSSFSAGEEGFC